MKRIAIVGGGIAGLSLAHALGARTRRDEVEIVVLEGSGRTGGNIRSERIDGYLCEWGPNGFLDSGTDTLALVRALGIEDRVQVSSDEARRRFIYRGGRLHELPSSPGAFLASGLLSLRGKLRIALEPFARRRPDRDESIHAFASRRIGSEAADVLIDSMVSGIFAGAARQLSLRACFPKMYDMETEFGGLFRAMFALRRRKRAAGTSTSGDSMGAPAGKLTSFAGGMEDLVTALTRQLGDIVQRERRVVAIEDRGPTDPVAGRRFLLRFLGRGTLDAGAVVLTGPSSVSAGIVSRMDSALAEELYTIPSAPLSVVCLGYDEPAVNQSRGPLDGFGFLVPRGEGVRILGVLWDSSVYPGRAPAGQVLLRVMIGGAADPRAIELDDEALLEIVRRELRLTMGLDVTPSFVRIIRHKTGIPQYTIGHLDRLARIDASLATHSGLFLAGNAYRGVAINACIAETAPLADRVIASLGRISSHRDAA
jgi:oxygen-dependent protoporphyrinogen oxidase